MRGQSAGIPAARKGCGGKQGGMLLPDIPPQSPSLLFGLHFLVDMNRSGKEEIQQHPSDGGKPDAMAATPDTVNAYQPLSAGAHMEYGSNENSSLTGGKVIFDESTAAASLSTSPCLEAVLSSVGAPFSYSVSSSA